MPTAPVRRTAVPNHRGTALRLTRRPEAPDPADLAGVRRWVASQDGPTAVDLFSGAGGLSLGLQDAGFSVLLGADSNAWAVETHTANIGGLGYCGDLSDPSELLDQLDGWGIRSVDLVAGGVPCQPFSRAGAAKIRELIRSGERHSEDPRASLWRSFMRFVESLEPKAVLIENVPDLPAKDDGVVFSGFLESLGGLGYGVDAHIVDCFRHGVPQHRSRLFVVGMKGGRRMKWPSPSDRLVSLKDAIGDLPPVPGGQRAERLRYHARPGAATPFQQRMRSGISGDEGRWIYDHMTRAVREDDWEAFRGLKPRQTYADIPSHLQRYRTDIFTDKYKRLSWDELSRTITAHIAKDGYWYIHPEQHRTLSIREAARLQTFPDDFRFAGQPSHRYAQIGNAVPPLIGEVIGRSLIDSLNQSPVPASGIGLREPLLAWHSSRPIHPWRHAGATAWSVLVGELTLERAGAATQRYFDELLRIAPDPRALLGLNSIHNLMHAGLSASAAKSLHLAAEAIVELFDGVLPDEDIELRAIPGVGDSIAKSILAFGFDRAVVPLNSSVARVATRVAGGEHRRRWQLRIDLHRLAGPSGPDAAFNAAVLDLGAVLCLPTRPRCDECPLQQSCATGRTQAQDDLN
jgi:DNA (cytosine-5)-methyltransferase 1